MNGNYTIVTNKTFTYQNPNGQTVTFGSDLIGTIQDTMGRYIVFHYDGNMRTRHPLPDNPEYSIVDYPPLMAITAPGYEGRQDRQIARFYYQEHDVTLNFQVKAIGRYYSNDPLDTNYGLAERVNELKYIYFPGTGSGYRYDYSAYGMIYRISQLRGMTVSTMSLSQAGTVISDGQVAAWTEYDYPQVPSNLPDAPIYTKRTDDWVGRTPSESMPSGAAPYYLFGVNETQGISTVTAPDGTVTETHSIYNPPTTSCSLPYCTPSDRCDPVPWNHGLIKDIFVKKNGNVVSHTHTEWDSGTATPPTPYTNKRQSNPRPAWVEVTNEVGQKRRTTYSYQAYNINNITEISEHDFSNPDGSPGPVLRRTVTEYETRSQWVSKGLRNLPVKTQIFVAGSNLPISRVDYKYDTDTPGAMLLPRPGIVMHTMANEYRGNVTSIVRYEDAANESGALTDKIDYDVAGNVVETTANCCRQKQIDYSLEYQYAYPIQITRGVSPLLSTSATYDFNTGLPKTATDENGQITRNFYDAASLRLIRTERPDGGLSEIEYQDQQLPNFVKTITKIDANRTVSSWQWANGRGAVYRTRTSTPEGYLSSDIEFDLMERRKRSSNPYTVANLNDPVPPDVKWSEVIERDDLGRTTAEKLPDNTITRTNYSGSVTTTTDQAGKRRRGITDAFGRIVRLDEPNLSGELGEVSAPLVPTYYQYDGLDNLTKMTQSADGATQERKFKYDSLSRLVYEKQVEASSTIADTQGNLWTAQYSYNSLGLLEQKKNARGVITSYSYDGLNRIQNISFSGETNYQTPAVTYTYGTNAANYSNGRLTKIETAATSNAPVTSQNYEYNLMGQIKKQSQSIGATSAFEAQNYVLEYGYNLSGQLTSQKYPSGREVTYSVDSAGRLSGVADGQRTYATNFQRNPAGLLSSVTLGNGATESFSFNNRLQLQSQSLVNGDTVVQRYDYAYGEINTADGTVNSSKNNGQLARVESYVGGTTASPNKQFQQRFVYDALGRLRQSAEHRGDNATVQVYQQTFSYDRFNNRFMKQSENQNPVLPYSAVEEAEIDKNTNRFKPTTNTIYDSAGNTVLDGKFRDMTYSYDANGRMIKAVSNSDSSISEFVHDALGRRVAAKINGVWQYFVYDISGRLVAEYGQPSSGQQHRIKYVHADWQGSKRVTTNSNGWAVSRQDFAAFGEEIPAGVGQGRTIQQNYRAGNTKQLYAQTEKDESTGLNHTPWRKQDAFAGRWTSPDPYNGSMTITDPQTLNRYSYVGNDPVNKIDPSGLTFIGVTTQVNSGLNVNNDYDWAWEDPEIVLPEEFVTVTAEDDPLLEHELAIAAAIDRANGVNNGEVDSRDVGPGCNNFAALVEELARTAADAAAFMQALVNRTIGANEPLDASSRSDFDRAQGIGGARLDDSGFKDKYDDGTGLQVRHFVGGLWAGYLYGSVIGLAGMQAREHTSSMEPIAGEEQDIALNFVSVPLGANLVPRPEVKLLDRVGTKMVTNVIPANPGYRGLAAEIRRSICN